LRARRRRALGGAIVLIVAVALVAVFSHEDPNADVQFVRRAPDRVLERGPVHLSLRFTLAAADGSLKVSDVSAEVDVRRHASEVRLASSVTDRPVRALGVERILYLTEPADSKARWVRVRVASESVAQGAGVGTLPDPLSVLHALDGATGVRRDGRTARFAVVAGEITDAARRRVVGELGSRLTGEATFDKHDVLTDVHLRARVRGGGHVDAVVRVTELDDLEVAEPDEGAVVDVATLADALRLVGVR